ncbi:hypothetical protein PWT90_07803 [Aphanocladium album]|nr:hypothetical protein PWT90_07803 [Aphanocladium album]
MSEILAGAVPANTVRFRMRSLPGHKFSYAGSGTVLLQLFIEAVVGKEYILYSPLPATGNNATMIHWNEHMRTKAEYHHLPELAAAGLWSTPAGLLRAIHDVQRSLSGDGGLLSQKTSRAREMINEVHDGMELGWGSFEEDKIAFGHSGSNEPGYLCHAAGYAKQVSEDVPRESGIAVMTNSSGGYAA